MPHLQFAKSLRVEREEHQPLLQVGRAECPNHVAQLVEKLQSFEAYSKDCESRDEADRAVHAALYKSSVAARLEMEKALTMLIAHEQIQL